MAATTTFTSGTSLTSTGSIDLLGILLRFAGKLNRDLAIKDLFARELGNCTLGFAWGREVDECVSDRAVGTWVLGDGGGFAVGADSSAAVQNVTSTLAIGMVNSMGLENLVNEAPSSQALARLALVFEEPRTEGTGGCVDVQETSERP